MAERPILFNTEMVKAIMDGRKTQTRRLVKEIALHAPYFELCDDAPYVCDMYGEWHPAERFCRIQPCDILWVRETWHKDAGRYMYRANYADDEKFYRDGKEVQLRWSPSIHMPKEAARLFLRVKDVRMERLQDITEEQAEKEGCASWHVEISGGPWGVEDDPDEGTAVDDFQCVWGSTIKPADRDKYGWEANPWVWVITFERCDKPKGWC